MLETSRCQVTQNFHINLANICSLFQRSTAQIHRVKMGHASAFCTAQYMKVFAPAGGFYRYQSVVFPFHMSNHPIGQQQIHIGKRTRHHAAVALIKNTGNIRAALVEARHTFCGKIPADGQKIRIAVTQNPNPVIHSKARQMKYPAWRI